MKNDAFVGRILYTFVLTAGLALAAPTSSAQNVGFAGPSYVGSGSFPTGAKAQSKLWFHDGKWWGSLWSEAERRFTIHRYETSSHTWTDTGVIIDPRHNSHSDCMMEGNKLYVGSHRFLTNANEVGNPIGLYRFTYVDGPDTYTLDPGFPVVIGDVSTEMMVIEKDSTGRLWAVWIQNLRVMVTHSVGDEQTWVAPFVLPQNTTDLHVDDICSMVRFGGNKIGVMWSDKNVDGFFFSFHLDSAGDLTWQPVETVIAGPGISEDHLNLKSSADGRVFAMLKTGTDNVLLQVRQVAGGWNSHLVAGAAVGWTRPIVVLDETARKIHAFATSPILFGDIYEKVTSMDAIAFPAGIGTPFMRDALAPSLNDVTSTKRSVNAQSGLVVLASHQPARTYWQRYVFLGGTPPAAPVASFVSAHPSGVVPFPAQFTDTSSGGPTSWRWDFGDGTTSSEQNPTHTYTKPGTYAVTLQVENELGSDTLVSKRQVLVGSRPATR